MGVGMAIKNDISDNTPARKIGRALLLLSSGVAVVGYIAGWFVAILDWTLHV